MLTGFFQDSDQDQGSYLLDQDWSRTKKKLSPNTSGVDMTLDFIENHRQNISVLHIT